MGVRRCSAVDAGAAGPGILQECAQECLCVTGCRECIVIRAQAEEQEERREPHAYGKERRHLAKRRRGLRRGAGTSAERAVSSALPRVVHEVGKVKEPDEVVGDNEDARSDERQQHEQDERPGTQEVLQVDDMAEYREGDV